MSRRRRSFALNLPAQQSWDRRLRRAFDEWAPEYRADVEWRLESRGHAYSRLAETVWEALGRPAAGLILETGCGPGPVGERVHRSHRVNLVGLDISREMLLRAEGRAYDALIHASAEALPLRSSSIDGVYSTFMLHSVRDRRRALRELRRVLKPGAPGVIVDLCVDDAPSPLRTVRTAVHAAQFEHGAPSTYFSPGELIGELADVGLHLVNVSQLGEHREYTHRCFAFRRPASDVR